MSFFNYEWVDAPPYPDPAAQHTMARLSIKLDGQEATWLRSGNTYQEHIEVPLSHLAEWIVTNWWHLSHEADSIYGSSRPCFASRHDLSYAGNGFVFPRIIFRPEGKHIVVSNERWYAPHAHIEFLLECKEMFETIFLQNEFQDLVEQVISRLNDKNVTNVSWIKEWSVIKNKLNDDEKEFCQATALLGLDPFDIEDELASTIVTVWNHLDPLIRKDLMLASEATTLNHTYEWITQSLASANQSYHALWSEVKSIVRIHSTDAELPWKAGANDARTVLREIGLEPGPFSFDGEYAISYTETVSPTSRIEGCVGEDTPSCVVVSKRNTGKKFLIARALGHYIAHDGNQPAVLSKLRTPEQSRARSFAAELLAPSEWLRLKIGSKNDVEQDEIYDLAEELDVSEFTVQWQIQNHEIARISLHPQW